MVDVDVLRDRWLEPPEPEEIGICICCGFEIYKGEPYDETEDGVMRCVNCRRYGDE